MHPPPTPYPLCTVPLSPRRPGRLLAVSILAKTHAGVGGGSVVAVDMLPDRLRVAERCIFHLRFCVVFLRRSRYSVVEARGNQTECLFLPPTAVCTPFTHQPLALPSRKRQHFRACLCPHNIGLDGGKSAAIASNPPALVVLPSPPLLS